MTGESQSGASDVPDGSDVDECVSLKTGDMVGPYEIIEQIMEGSFGIVYRAEQNEPFRRAVALKLIKPGLETKKVLARFATEQQSLALMNHPNIAKVFDAGVTENGRPYFAMEYISGKHIDKYCDDNQLSITERLKLFCSICSAIQHAHQKGIVHRDIKPSNIIVTDKPDGQREPIVIDFGISKALQNPVGDPAGLTLKNEIFGTPYYASPEQAEGGGIDVDTRSDIYSLGALLYQLISGTLHIGTNLQSIPLNDIWTRVRESETQRPSARIGELNCQEATDRAQQRSTDLAQLKRLLSGDLDWIVLKCLEKDRCRRYQTANELAADVQRHLNDEPIIARPPEISYRIQKAWRRNKIAISLFSIATAVILFGIFVSLYGYIKAQHAKAAVESSAAEVFSLNNILTSVLNRRAQWFESPSEMSQFVYEEIRKTYPTNTLSRVNLIIMVASALNKYNRGADSLPMWRELVAYSSTMPTLSDSTKIKIITGLSKALIDTGSYDVAYTNMAKISEAILSSGNIPNNHKVQYWCVYSDTLRRHGQIEKAVQTRRLAHKMVVETYGAESKTGLESSVGIAALLVDSGAADEALKILLPYEKLIDDSRYPADTRVTWLITLANTYRTIGRVESAFDKYQQAISIADLSLTHDDPLRLEAQIAGGIYALHYDSNDAQARINLRQSIAGNSDLWAFNPTVVQGRLLLQRSAVYGIAFEPEEDVKRFSDDLEKQYGPSHPLTIESKVNLGYSMHLSNKTDEALAIHAYAYEQAMKLPGEGHPVMANALVGFGDSLNRSGHFAECIRLVENQLMHGGKASFNSEPASLLLMKMLVIKMWQTRAGVDQVAANRLLDAVSDSEVPHACERIAKVVCLRSNMDMETYRKALELARRANEVGGRESIFNGWNILALALAELRNGNTMQCLTTLKRINANTADLEYFKQAVPIIKSLCLAKQGHKDQAAQVLNRAGELLGGRPNLDINGLVHYWGHDTLILWILFDEATRAVSQSEER